jgi:hypothetical protein
MKKQPELNLELSSDDLPVTNCNGIEIVNYHYLPLPPPRADRPKCSHCDYSCCKFWLSYPSKFTWWCRKCGMFTTGE